MDPIARAWNEAVGGCPHVQSSLAADHRRLLGWSPATNGVVRGPLAFVPRDRVEDFQAYQGRLKGAIVILSGPVSLSSTTAVMGSPTPIVQAPGAGA